MSSPSPCTSATTSSSTRSYRSLRFGHRPSHHLLPDLGYTARCTRLLPRCAPSRAQLAWTYGVGGGQRSTTSSLCFLQRLQIHPRSSTRPPTSAKHTNLKRHGGHVLYTLTTTKRAQTYSLARRRRILDEQAAHYSPAVLSSTRSCHRYPRRLAQPKPYAGQSSTAVARGTATHARAI